MGIVVAMVAVSMSGLLLRTGRSDDGERALYFSVASKSSTGGFMGAKFIVIFGSGTFDGESVDATGIWSIGTGLPPSSMNTVASGTWEGTQVVSFVSYGVANPRGEGGQLIFKATFHFDNGETLTGVTLTMTCLIGTPPAGVEEGVTVSGPLTYDVSLAGITTFGQPPD